MSLVETETQPSFPVDIVAVRIAEHFDVNLQAFTDLLLDVQGKLPEVMQKVKTPLSADDPDIYALQMDGQLLADVQNAFNLSKLVDAERISLMIGTYVHEKRKANTPKSSDQLAVA